MRILYVARHGPRDNQDEDAITHALRELGHIVECVPEGVIRVDAQDYDFALFNHNRDYEQIKDLPIPTVFWCFDLIDSKCPSLTWRDQDRRKWMAALTEVTDLGFMSDGDWVDQDETGKLHHLMQGADTRVAFPEMQQGNKQWLLFTGSKQGGLKRTSCIDELTKIYKNNFEIFPQLRRGRRRRIHGKTLAHKIAGARICIAPDFPCTNRYVSNRAVLTIGFGGFLIHPYSEMLTHLYQDRKEIVYYRNRSEMHALIRHYSTRPEERREIRQAGYARTMRDHTYIDRCRVLIDTVQERLF